MFKWRNSHLLTFFCQVSTLAPRSVIAPPSSSERDYSFTSAQCKFGAVAVSKVSKTFKLNMWWIESTAVQLTLKEILIMENKVQYDASGKWDNHNVWEILQSPYPSVTLVWSTTSTQPTATTTMTAAQSYQQTPQTLVCTMCQVPFYSFP